MNKKLTIKEVEEIVSTIKITDELRRKLDSVSDLTSVISKE